MIYRDDLFAAHEKIRFLEEKLMKFTERSAKKPVQKKPWKRLRGDTLLGVLVWIWFFIPMLLIGFVFIRKDKLELRYMNSDGPGYETRNVAFQGLRIIGTLGVHAALILGILFVWGVCPLFPTLTIFLGCLGGTLCILNAIFFGTGLLRHPLIDDGIPSRDK